MALEIRFRIIDLPFEAAKSIDASCVSTPARSLDDVVQDGGADLNGRLGSVAALSGARLQRAVVLAEEDDAAVGVRELEEREEDLVEQPVEVALEADVARQLPGDAQALVVEPELLRVVRDLRRTGGSPSSARRSACRWRARSRARRRVFLRSLRRRPTRRRLRAGSAADAGIAGRGGWRVHGGALERLVTRHAAGASRLPHRATGTSMAARRMAEGAAAGGCAGRRLRRRTALLPAAGGCAAACCDGAGGLDAPGRRRSGGGSRSRRRSARGSSRARSRRRACSSSLAADALAVDVGAVQAPEIAQDEPPVALLDDAVLLRHDLVEELDRVVGMPSEAVDRTQLDRLLPFGGREDQLVPCASTMLARCMLAWRQSPSRAQPRAGLSGRARQVLRVRVDTRSAPWWPCPR